MNHPDYTDAQSEFVKAEIKKTPWKRRGYIDALLEIERWALHGFHGLTSGQRELFYKTKYRKECKIIFAELNPKKWAARIAREAKDKQERLEEAKRWCEEEEREQREAKRRWMIMGGRE